MFVSWVPKMPGMVPILLPKCGPHRKKLLVSCAGRNSDCTDHLQDDVVPTDSFLEGGLPEVQK